METGYQPKESEKQNETNSEATPSASTKPEANNDKKPSAEAEENFVVVELQGRRRSSSYVDPVEACDFWKLHKESYIALRAWEDEKTAKAKNLKDLLNWLCDSLTLKMSKVNSSNQSLMSYFSLVATNIKELSKHCSKTTSPLDPIIAYHTFIGLPLAELFKKLKGANNNFFNSLKVFATFIEQKIVEELKEMTIKYAKTLAGLKELKPNLLLGLERAERKFEEYFNKYCAAIGNKEAYVLKVRNDDVDIWIPERQVLLSNKEHLDALKKYVDFANELITEGKKLETLRTEHIGKAFEEYYHKNSATFGSNQALFGAAVEAAEEVKKSAGSSDGILSPKLLFEGKEVIQQIAKAYYDKYKDLSLDNIKDQLTDEFKTFAAPPESNLVEKKGKLKRGSGLFNAWVPCTLNLTKDKYLYIFDMENDYKPVFTFDLVRAQAKTISGEEEKEYKFEIVETKKKVVVGVLPTSKTLKFLADSEAEVNEWVEWINGIKKKE